MAIAVVIPGQFGESFSASRVYARRRLMALISLITIVLVLLVGAGHVVANRGGAPASASMIRPATATAAVSPVYVAQAGDTMWSIAQRFRGSTSIQDYVDALIDVNGGTQIQISQAVTLP